MLMKRTYALVSVLLAVPATAVTVRADVAAIPPVVPATTKVLILPTLDTTADRPEMQQEHIVTSDHRLAYEFLIRGFPVEAPDVAIRAARTSDIDLTAPDERTRKNLKIMGGAAGATWVVALTVMNVEEARSGNFLSGGGRRAKAKVEIRIWDVAADTYITNKFYEDTKSTKRLFNSIGTTGLFRQAIDTTVQRSVQDILTPYPIIKHLQDQFNETDVVGGESASGLASGGTAAGKLVLAAGTPVTVVLQSMLRSDVARDGDPVTFHVKNDVYSTEGSHTRFIAKDAVAMGRVIVAKERGYAGKAGSMQFTCDYVLSATGKRVYLRRDQISQVGHSNENGAIALTVLAGTPGLLLSGHDAKFDAGTPFTLYVDQDAVLSPDPAPLAAIAPPVAQTSAAPVVPMTLFTMSDGSQVVGRLVSFDGTNYSVATPTGNVSLGAASVKSMNVMPAAPVQVVPPPQIVPPAPVVLTPAPDQVTPPTAPVVPVAAAPVQVSPVPVAATVPSPIVPQVSKVVAAPAPAPKPAPRLPVISKFPQRVHVTLTDGTIYVCTATSFDDGGYSFTLDTGAVLNTDESRVKALELLPAGN